MRRRLAVTAAAVTAMVVLAFCLPLALVVRTVARDRAEHAAELEARSLAAILAGSRDPAVLAPIVASANAGSARPASVILPDGTVLGDATPPGAELARARAGEALTIGIGGGDEAVLVPVQGPEGVAVARVLVPAAQLRRGVTQAWVVLGALSVLLVALAVGLADRLARSLVASVEQLQGTARRLRQGDRRARAGAVGPPEVAEVALELNRLADEIDAMIAAEREQIADLSHRLRTPLTALRLDVDGLAPGSERDRLVGEVEALETAVDRQIREARGDGPPRPAGAVDVVASLRDRLAFWSVLATDQGRAMSVDLPDGPCPVSIDHDDLAAAVDALLGNVFTHTPAGTALHVGLRDGDGTVTLTVADAGPGFADSEAQALGRGTSGAGSTGLGLDIARRTAEQAGGGLRVGARSDGPGALVELTLRT